MHFDGKTQKRVYSRAEMAVIYRENRSDEALEDYAPDPTRRLYMCACSSGVISTYPEHCIALRLDTGPLWSCAGHDG